VGERSGLKIFGGRRSFLTSGPLGVRRAEARTLEAAWHRYPGHRGRRPRIPKRVRDYLYERTDASGEFTVEYGVWGIPENYFIDRKGRITYKQVGALGWPIITAKLDEALRGIVSAEEGRGDYLSVR